jgi:hypothetical protein
MNNLNTLKKILEVVTHADREFSVSTPLYQIKSLFDALQLDGDIDFDSVHGELIQSFLSAKRVDAAMANILRSRSVLESAIKVLEQEQVELDESQKEQDSLSIESTCEVVNVTSNKKENQLKLNDIPKKLGRPKSENALSGAQRAKRARDKKKANKLVTINTSLSMHASNLYNQMIESGYDLNSIIEMAHNQVPLLKD